MSEKIKAVYLDIDGNQHETKATAKKANRLIDSAVNLSEELTMMKISTMSKMLVGDELASEPRADIIEFARAVVAIYGMRDKPEAK